MDLAVSPEVSIRLIHDDPRGGEGIPGLGMVGTDPTFTAS